MRITTFIWLLFLGILLFLSFNYHGKAPSFTHRSQIWSDKAGYHVYLPFTLIYGSDPQAMPDSIVTKTGLGFSIDESNNTLHTKYTYGVAIMQLPFFVAAHILSNPLGFEASGYSRIYNWAIDVAGVFYLVLSLFLLSRLLLKNNSKKAVYLGLFFLYFGSNLFYYSIDETGMSHVYSFFLFTLFLGILQKTEFLKINSTQWILALGLTVGLIILVRPLNILILFTYFFWRLESKEEFFERLKRIFQPKAIVPMLGCFLLIWLPQMIFWENNEGSYFHYSYGEEGFNWLKPQWMKVWFAASSGAFLYGGMAFVIFLLALYKTVKQWNKYGFYLFLFLVLSYITSCWWSWSFGCSYGMRNLAEYFALFAFLFIPSVEYLLLKKRFTQSLVFGFLLTITFFNIQLSYSYGGCFFGENDWDFKEFYRLATYR